jgi:peptide/nickel transport system permease protein
VVLFGTLAGALIGLGTGFLGGTIDLLAQRLIDAFQALPGLIFAMALMSVLGASINHVVLAIAMFSAQGMRGSSAARCCGSVLSFNFVGDAVRDVIDPQTRRI